MISWQTFISALMVACQTQDVPTKKDAILQQCRNAPDAGSVLDYIVGAGARVMTMVTSGVRVRKVDGESLPVETTSLVKRGLLLLWCVFFLAGAPAFAQDTRPSEAPAEAPQHAAEQEAPSSMQSNTEPPRMHPANLGLRFGLELAAFTAMGAWGLDQADGVAGYGLMMGVPASAAAAWGAFTVPEDPSRGGKGVVEVPGIARLGIELAVFGFASWALHDMGHGDLGRGLTVTTAVHYAVSFRRIKWLLGK